MKLLVAIVSLTDWRPTGHLETEYAKQERDCSANVVRRIALCVH